MQAVGVEGETFGVPADDGGDAVDTYFDGFFDKPFKACVVFGGCHGDVELERAGIVVRQAFQYFNLAGRGVWVDNTGTAEGAVAAGDVEFVAELHAEDTDAVFRFVGRKSGVWALGGVGEEEVHGDWYL